MERGQISSRVFFLSSGPIKNEIKKELERRGPIIGKGPFCTFIFSYGGNLFCRIQVLIKAMSKKCGTLCALGACWEAKATIKT